MTTSATAPTIPPGKPPYLGLFLEPALPPHAEDDDPDEDDDGDTLIYGL